MVFACLAAFFVLRSAPSLADGPPDKRSPWARSRPEDLIISLVTMGPGDDIYNYFGHNALTVQDRTRRALHLYNFGMFSFGRDMLPNYLKGRLTFWVADMPARATFAHYIAMNRSVRVQELNLPPAARKAMADSLATNALPENRNYLYEHFWNNCSTRLRDLIDAAIGGQFKRALTQPARMSHRGHTRRYAQKNPGVDFALVFWMNDEMERPITEWDELFLPEELERQVARMRYIDAGGKAIPLAATSYTIYEARRPPVPDRPPRSWPWTLLFGCSGGVALWLTALWMRRRASRLARALFGVLHAVFGSVFGLYGTVGFLMWAFTEHAVTFHNENQLLANPITLCFLPLGIAMALGSNRALRWTGYLFNTLAAMSLSLLVLKLLPSFNQDTSLTMTLLLPLNLGGALAHRVLHSHLPQNERTEARTDPSR